MRAIHGLCFTLAFTIWAQTSVAAVQTFSVGGELAQLFIPNGMCVLNESSLSSLHIQKTAMGKNDIVAVFAPCSLVDGNSLTELPEIWGMWLAQRQVIPRNVSRWEFVNTVYKDAQQKADMKILGKDDNAMYTAMQITGRKDAVDAVVTITKLNNRALALNLYKNHSSTNPTNLLQLAKTVVNKTIAEQPQEPMTSTERIINKAVTGGAGAIMFMLLMGGVSAMVWVVKRIYVQFKKG